MPNKLQHVGVLGMKWGRRKVRTASEDHTSALGGLKGKKAHELSNNQIRKAAERIQLERQYTSLTTKEKSFGRKTVEGLFQDNQKALLTFAATTASAFVVKKVMDNKDKIFDKALDIGANLIKIVPKSG